MYDYTQKYVEGDQKGSSVSFAFGTTSGAPFSDLMAFKKGNAIGAFCFLFCTLIFSHVHLLLHRSEADTTDPVGRSERIIKQLKN